MVKMEGAGKALGKQVPVFLVEESSPVAMRRQRESCVSFSQPRVQTDTNS